MAKAVITLTPKKSALTTHLQEVIKIAAEDMNRNIQMTAQSLSGSVGGSKVVLKGDIASGLNISIPLSNNKTKMDDWFLKETLEKSVSSTVDFSYTNTLESAARIVAAKHAEDLL